MDGVQKKQSDCKIALTVEGCKLYIKVDPTEEMSELRV
jgi:hypothetical protein